MRTAPVLLLVLGLAAAAPAGAQAPAITPTTSPATALPIPLPPGAAVQTELDGRDADLLGVVKGLIAGMTAPKTREEAQATAAGSSPLSFLSDGQLTLLLKDIHHLHVVSFKPADPPAVTASAGAAAPPPTDYLAFYEKPFEAEGGHRLLYSHSGSSPVVAVGFDQPRGFAAVFLSSGLVTVIRADGYPDMTVLGGLLRTFGAGAAAANMPASPARKATVRKAARPKARRA